jgi:hypothetical protein
VVALLLGLAQSSLAQTNGFLSVVTIAATDPVASWSGDTGTFTVFREGATNATLNVYYRIGGTASNGVDYAAIGNTITIPAGVRSNLITISPINNSQTNTKTVSLTLAPSLWVPPVNYEIGYPSNATVYISPSGSNIPPAVAIFSPTNGEVFTAPVNIDLFAKASDVDDSVTNVEFFDGANDLGRGLPVVLDPPGANGVTGLAYFLTWSNAPVGPHTLTAVATDNGGASTVSGAVNISVNPGPPPTNQPPDVTLFFPTNGSVFTAPVDIRLVAAAHDPEDGYNITVEFFAGTNDLGHGTFLPTMCPAPWCPSFDLVWSNVPPGDYLLTAKATDTAGATTTSNTNKVTVLPGPPPPTNLPPVVRIISPPNGAIFHAPVDIPIYTYAHDPDDAVASVEVFAGSNSLGLASAIVCPTNPPCPLCPVLICPTNIYLLVWSNAPLGTYALTALATDTRGASSVSGPVKIAILPSPPPPTNMPPIVNIVATDPIAVEGTNCWPWVGLTNITTASPWAIWSAGPTVCRFFTNCGPKNATFTVHRIGDTNDPVVVNYAIGGTASNGVEYVTLPGSVTIPAGERSALVAVVPIDDGPPDITSTVILKLKPDTNYIIGFPAAAAAIILDPPFPRPISRLLPGNCFHVNAAGPDGAWFHVEYTTDLLHWTPICTNQVVQGSIDFVDPDASADGARFYRAVPETAAPAE